MRASLLQHQTKILNNNKFILFEFLNQEMLPQKKIAPQFKAGYNIQQRVRTDDMIAVVAVVAGYNDYAQR